MNYEVLDEDDVDNEINNDKELRNIRKKLKKKEDKLKLNPSNTIISEINLLKTLINEYCEMTSNNPTKKKKKKKKKKNNNEDFLEQEFRKNNLKNQEKYKREEKEKKDKQDKKDKKDKQDKQDKKDRDRERKRREREEEEREDRESISDIDLIIEKHGFVKNRLPIDIQALIANYDIKSWKKRMATYHPDKCYNDTYGSLLNSIRDYYQ